MVTINVRRLDDEVVDRLKARASRNNRSLEGEARHILECAADGDMAAKRAAFAETIKRRRPLTEGRKHTPAEVLIREDRDRGHRRRLLMRFVIDASVAVKWLVAEDEADVAEELATGGHDLHAPRLMASEVANALWRKARTAR